MKIIFENKDKPVLMALDYKALAIIFIKWSHRCVSFIHKKFLLFADTLQKIVSVTFFYLIIKKRIQYHEIIRLTI